LQGLVLAPLDRSLIFLGKFLANWLLLLLVDVFVLGAFFIFYNLTVSVRLLLLLLLMALVGLALSSVGTLFAAMVSGVRTRDVLLPILVFPILVPVVIAAVNATRELLGPGELDFFGNWLNLLVVSNIIFLAASLAVFDFVLED
jgi:heme exporter protein B